LFAEDVDVVPDEADAEFFLTCAEDIVGWI
jgi:hypothetical protein